MFLLSYKILDSDGGGGGVLFIYLLVQYSRATSFDHGEPNSVRQD